METTCTQSKRILFWSISIVTAESVLLNAHDFEKKCINYAFFGSCKYLEAHNTILQHNIWLLTLFDIPLMQINRWRKKLQKYQENLLFSYIVLIAWSIVILIYSMDFPILNWKLKISNSLQFHSWPN